MSWQRSISRVYLGELWLRNIFNLAHASTNDFINRKPSRKSLPVWSMECVILCPREVVSMNDVVLRLLRCLSHFMGFDSLLTNSNKTYFFMIIIEFWEDITYIRWMKHRGENIKTAMGIIVEWIKYANNCKGY